VGYGPKLAVLDSLAAMAFWISLGICFQW